MPKKETPRDRKLYTEPSWALESLKGVEQKYVIEKGHEKLGTHRMGRDYLKPFYLSRQEATQLRDEVHEAMPDLKNSGLTLKQKMRLLSIKKRIRNAKNRTREQEGKTRRRVR